MKLDVDIKSMTAGQARQALMKSRQAVRWHAALDENARCWHADLQLYARVLPEAVKPGKMRGPKEELLRQCSRYIDRQKCRTCSHVRRINHGT